MSNRWTSSSAVAMMAPSCITEPLGEGGQVVGVQDQVVRHRIAEDQPVALAVFRDVRDPRLQDLAGGWRGSCRGLRCRILPAGDGAQPGQGFDQLGLSVALHAGDCQGSRPRGPRTRRRSPQAACGRPGPAGPSTSSTTSPGCAGFLSTVRITSRPTIIRAKVARIRFGGPCRPDDASIAQDGDPVGDLHHLFQLVGDEDDRDALAPPARESP